jgi:AGCS family alanine or glycine:cation symporter
LLFGFTSIVANFVYADNNLKYLKIDNVFGRWFLRIGFFGMLVYGSVASLPEVIALADLSTGLMTIFNVSALFLLSKVVVNITKDYSRQQKLKQLPRYIPDQEERKQLNLSKGIWQKED